MTIIVTHTHTKRVINRKTNNNHNAHSAPAVPNSLVDIDLTTATDDVSTHRRYGNALIPLTAVNALTI